MCLCATLAGALWGMEKTDRRAATWTARTRKGSWLPSGGGLVATAGLGDVRIQSTASQGGLMGWGQDQPTWAGMGQAQG